MKLLAIETSTECCSAALLVSGTLRLRDTLTDRGHAELVLPYVDELLREAGLTTGELDGIAFGRGPGAFTGLRIAAGVAQGLAYAAGLEVAAVSSLAAVAERVPATAGDSILICNDARMGELYWGHFRRRADGTLEAFDGEHVGAPEAVRAAARAAHVAGNGLARHPVLARDLAAQGLKVHPGIYPRADAVARLGCAIFAAGRALPPESALPVYVRDEVATVRAPL